MRSFAVPGLLALVAVIGMAALTAPAASATTTTTNLNVLYGVSCLSAKACVAVGGDVNSTTGKSIAIAEIWNGTRWKAVPVKQPSGTSDASLNSVSCPSAVFCVAVGAYEKGGSGYGLAETWNGTAWTPATLPRPPSAISAMAAAVSCALPKNCLATGLYGVKSGTMSVLADVLAGPTWTVRMPLTPAGSQFETLGGVSCASTSFCVLAGDFVTKTDATALLESWNGKSFTRMQVPVPAGTAISTLAAVSCHSAKSCAAVGQAANAASSTLTGLGELWNGKGWSIAKVPTGTDGTLLSAVSCASTTRCAGAGAAGGTASTQGAGGGRASAADYDGKAWALTSVPAPAKGDGSVFNAISCWSPAGCVAVGDVGPVDGSDSAALTGFWNGKGWKLVTAS